MRFLKVLVLSTICISNIFSQSVDNFTGSFNYSAPLITLPGGNGMSIPVSASYGSGIGVFQNASEIGLGWNLSLGGAITRSVSGVPDDWMGPTLPNSSTGEFDNHIGAMYLSASTLEGNSSTKLYDFFNSKWKNPYDTILYHAPNFDYYNLSGPGIGGQIKPHLFDFATMGVDHNGKYGSVTQCNGTQKAFTKKMQFHMFGDFYNTLRSRHYPDPIDGTTVLKLPGEAVSGSSEPIESVYPDGYSATSNRLAGGYFIEFFTNNEINNGVSGFIDYKTPHTRSSSEFDLNGIGAFRVTDPNGYTFHYSLPVYINYTVNGSYPLNNDYSPKMTYDDDKIYSGSSYVIKDADHNNHVTEWKTDKKYAYQWLLVAVTGPDYEDTNADGLANSSDKGYWISFENMLWSNDFKKRTPEFGYDYSFTGTHGDVTENKELSASDKITGKTGVWSVVNQQIYYTNKITSSTHSLLVVRDLRNDDHASPYFYGDHKTLNINTTTFDPLQIWAGVLYDDGGSAANYGTNRNDDIILEPTEADQVEYKFNIFDAGAGYNTDYFYVYDWDAINQVWNTTPTATYHTFGSAIPPTTWLTSTSKKVKFVFQSDGNNDPADSGFEIEYRAKFNSRPLVTPQLKVNKLLLLRNSDLSTLPSVTPLTNPVGSNWDLSRTTNTVTAFYNNEWFTTNSNSINGVSIESIDFLQEYSLAKKYFSNTHLYPPNTSKYTPPPSVFTSMVITSGQEGQSGKLTLNEIINYGFARVQATPSVKFDYNASSTEDNPDYNPKMIDNWGYYKHDVSSNGYSSYTSAASGNLTDAWSLRKITLPTGGNVEIEYESNRYEKTFSQAGGFKGSSRIYLIDDASYSTGTRGADWDIVFEDATDFWEIASSPPAGTVQSSSIPFNVPELEVNCKSWGESILTNSTPVRLASLDTLGFCTADKQDYTWENTFDLLLTTEGAMPYSGNGYVILDLPVGFISYGGGPRVKRLNSRVSASEIYVQDYEYSQGVVPSEPDRFSNRKKVYGTHGKETYKKLGSFEGDLHHLPSMVGYGEVITRNLGRINQAQGYTKEYFQVADLGVNNYNIHMEQRLSTICSTYDTTYILEISDKFRSLWGKNYKAEEYDINGNLLTKVLNTFSFPEKGALVQVGHFILPEVEKRNNIGELISRHQNGIICILRTWSSTLTKQEIFKGGSTISTEQAVSFDKISGQSTLSRVTSDNGSIVVQRSVPAFRISQYADMGSKFLDPLNKNLLSGIAVARLSTDTAITASSNFNSEGITVYANSKKVRKYSSVTGKFENANEASPWGVVKQYHWKGSSTSLDSYGLFKSADTDYTPFDFSLAAIDSRWNFDSEITLFDEKYHVLETKGFNDRYSAIKYGYKELLPIASISNSTYGAFTYSGFENLMTVSGVSYADGEVKLNDGEILSSSGTVLPHTGNYFLKVSGGAPSLPFWISKYNSTVPYDGLIPGKTYRASVWVHQSSDDYCKLTISLTGQTSVSIQKNSVNGILVGNWILLTLDYTVPAVLNDNDELKVSLERGSVGSSYFDDFRFQSVESVLQGQVYDHATNRVISVLDENNFATKFIYDAGGRVIEEWKEIEGVGFKKVKTYQYNYGRGVN